MANPSGTSLFTTFSELVSTTFRNHKKSFADNVTTHNALWRRLSDKGRIRLEDGGLSIVEPLEYATNSTFQRYSGFDTLNIQAVDVLTAAEFAWKQAAENVAISGLEMRSNSGESRIINFTKAKLKNAMNSFANNMASDICSDGTAANQIGGLQAVIADAQTGTIGGQNGEKPYDK